MTTIKKYNNSTGQWEAIVVGQQGIGIPAGGAVGQILVKNSNTDYDMTWASVNVINAANVFMMQNYV